jgi:hypothetical protein
MSPPPGDPSPFDLFRLALAEQKRIAEAQAHLRATGTHWLRHPTHTPERIARKDGKR